MPYGTKYLMQKQKYQREYVREWQKNNRHKKYGVTKEELELEQDRFGGKCHLCLSESKRTSKYGAKHALSIDHDHATGRLRGALCHTCNTGLGQIGDNSASCQAALFYLAGERFPAGMSAALLM